MVKTDAYAEELEQLVWDPSSAERLAARLKEQSNLPGPRANLALVEAFADAVSTEAAEPAAWLETLYAWAAMSVEEAPEGDPAVFLPVCAVVALGVLFHTHACAYPCTGPCDCPLWPIQAEHLVEAIRRAASDSRWRVREAAAMALQHLGEGNPESLRRILDGWLEADSLLERRAALAALAHPPLLHDERMARHALKIADRIFQDAAKVAPEQRKSEDFRVLKKGLSYAPSVLAAHLPKEGFALLERLADSADADIRKMVAANLKKKRLQAVDSKRAAGILKAATGV